MKTLSKFVVKVTTQEQLDIAIKFFRRASRRPLHCRAFIVSNGFASLYVGMCRRTVNSSPLKYPFEKVIEFNDMALLADTPPRQQALKTSGFKVEAWKPRKELPLVQFDYPKRDSFHRTRRSVRLIQATPQYYMGLEILPDNKFQFKKFLKTKTTNVEVLTF